MTTGFVSCGQESASKNIPPQKKEDLSKYSKAAFAAGCFWHEEALFESIKGVKDAISGYAGGTAKNPNYQMIENANTGYAESVMVYYDPSIVSYETLLKVYFAGQDPTATNGQAPDFGSQYRSIAFYTNDKEKQQIENYIQQLNASGKYNAAYCCSRNATRQNFGRLKVITRIILQKIQTADTFKTFLFPK